MLLTQNKPKNSSSTILYIGIRYVAFIGASICSAIFNLILFRSMSPPDDIFLLFVMSSISIVLELTKISTVITANLFHDIYKKTFIPAILLKKRIFYTFYILLTLLSITASLGFTFTLNDRMNSISTTQLDQVENLQTKLESLQVRELNIDRMEDGIATQEQDIVSNTITLQSSTITNNVQSNQALRVANDDYNTAQNELNRYTDAKTQYDRIQELLRQEDALRAQRQSVDDVANIDSQLDSIEQQLEDTRYIFDQYASLLGLNERTFNSDYEIVRSTRDNAQRNLDRVRASNTVTADVTLDSSILDTSRANITAAIASLDVDKGIFLQDINQYIVDTNPTSGKVITSITEAETYLVQLSKDIKENAGVNVMFREFGKLFRTDPSLITLIILMFVSILIELTIYQTSPDLKPTRKILFFFRNHLADVDMPKLFIAFDEENNMWTDDFDPYKKASTTDSLETPEEIITTAEVIPIIIEEKKSNKPKVSSKKPSSKKKESSQKTVVVEKPKKKSEKKPTVRKKPVVSRPAASKKASPIKSKPVTIATPSIESVESNILPLDTPQETLIIPEKDSSQILPEEIKEVVAVEEPPIPTIKLTPEVEKKIEEVEVEAPEVEAPVEKAPVEKAPVEKAPAEKAPVEKAPVEKAPVVEAPIRELHKAISLEPELEIKETLASPQRDELPIVSEGVYNYRFGKATEEVMKLVQKFIHKLFSEPGTPHLYDPDTISKELKIKPALGKLFMKRFQELITPEKKPLIYLADDGLYYSNYDKEFILAYVTAPVRK